MDRIRSWGDRYPVTDREREYGAISMALGVGIFGILTGFLANAFVNPPGQGECRHGGESGDVQRAARGRWWERGR